MSQTKKLLELLNDGHPHRSDEILRVVYGSDHLGCARIAARIADLRKQGHIIPNAKPDPHNPSLSWYQKVIYNLNGVPINRVVV